MSKPEQPEQELLLAAVWESSADAMRFMNSRGIVINVNNAYCILTGFDKEFIVGKSFEIVNTENEQPELQKYFRELISSGKTTERADGKVTFRDGKQCYIEASHSRIEISGDIFILTIFRDLTEFMKAVEDVEENREKYRGLSEAAFESIFISEKGICIEQNLTAEKTFGFTNEEAIGRYGTDWIIPEDRDMVMKNMISGFENPYEATALRKDGTTFPCMLHGKMMRYKGRYVRVTSLSDITERKQAEKVILESEEKYKNLYRMLRMMCDNVPDLIWAKDLNRNFIFTNKAVCEKLLNAKDTDEPIGKNDMFFAKRERDSFSDNPKWHTFGEICRDSDSIVLESKHTEQFDEFGNVNGKFLFLDVYKTPFLDELGNIIGIVGCGRDVTRERKLAEDVRQTLEKLRESEEKFRNLAVLTPFAIMIYQNNKWIYTNPAGENISGYSAEELYEMHFWDFVAPEYLSLVKERGLKRQAGEPVSIGYEFKIIAKDGTEKWVYLNGSHIDYHGKPAGIIAIVDITNLKQIEEDLIIAKEKAEEMSRLKSSFLANMSHELRTPLSGILGFSEILRDDLADEEQKEYAEFIRKSGKRLLETLDLILNFAKLEAEKQEIIFSDVTFEDLIHETVQTFSAAAKAKNIYLKSIIKTNNFTAKSDERFIRHILDNLVNNAIKFTDEGGVTIELSKENNKVLIKVKDTGIGIAKDKCKIIFEEFRQESEGLGRNFEGTGLGLSIAKRFVELMKGTIEVESEVNAGSTFIVKFICEEAPETLNKKTSETITAKTKKEEPEIDIYIPKSSDSPAELFPEQEKYSVLLVEDDEVTIKLTAKILKEYYNVESAVNGLEAIEKAKKKVHDIILMDINLSKGIDGIETLRKIRKLPGYEKTPAVALTAYVLPGDMEEFLAGGCTHYLDKPFTRNQLLTLISDIIGSVKC